MDRGLIVFKKNEGIVLSSLDIYDGHPEELGVNLLMKLRDYNIDEIVNSIRFAIPANQNIIDKYKENLIEKNPLWNEEQIEDMVYDKFFLVKESVGEKLIDLLVNNDEMIYVGNESSSAHDYLFLIDLDNNLYSIYKTIDNTLEKEVDVINLTNENFLISTKLDSLPEDEDWLENIQKNLYELNGDYEFNLK